jgi:hypothetical protein
MVVGMAGISPTPSASAHGNTAFTVPLFEEFLKREIPDLMP